MTFDQQAQAVGIAVAKRLVAAAQSGDQPGLQVAVAGQVAEQASPPSIGGAGFGILLAAVVLLLVFGSLFARAAAAGYRGSPRSDRLGIIGLLSNLITMAGFSSQLSILIGLGVGVDYALFIVTRHRQGLQQGSRWRRRSSMRSTPPAEP